jgi:hypothetical protein
MKTKTTITYHSLYYQFVLVAFLLALLGCSSVVRLYPGPAMPADKTARLLLSEPIRIQGVDDQKVTLSFGTLELLPGSHTISVGYLSCVYASSCTFLGDSMTLTFEAKAGGSYTMEYSRVGDTWNAWIKDKVDGKDVSSKSTEWIHRQGSPY